VRSVTQLVPFVLIIGAFYLLIMRPSRSRQKAKQLLVDQLAVGARVMTTSGLYAVVAAIEDDGVLQLEVAPGVTMRWTKTAVARILPEPEPEREADDPGEGELDAEDEVPSEGAPEAAVSLSKSETDDADVESTERPT
jgi:preprotein translocase subunit YajC